MPRQESLETWGPSLIPLESGQVSKSRLVEKVLTLLSAQGRAGPSTTGEKGDSAIRIDSSPPRILMQTLLQGSASPSWVRATLARGCCACSRCGSTAAALQDRPCVSPLRVVETRQPRAPVGARTHRQDICNPWVAPGERGRGRQLGESLAWKVL